ncbi:MAG: diacylglycerol/polyprenol kinase family protein, partial [Dehalococcoidia bacterium]
MGSGLVQKNSRKEAEANLERRAFHIFFGSLFPLVAIVVPLWLVTALVALSLMASLALELARRRSGWVSRWFLYRFAVLLKREESSRLLGSTYLLMATLASFLLFDKYVAILALLFLSVGDPFAAFIGERWGRNRIGKKSIEGSLAFVVASLLVGGLVVGAGVDLSFSVV